MDAGTAWNQIPLMTKMACGARDAMASDEHLSFRVGGGAKLRKIIIRLNALDLYDVEYFEVKRKTYDVVKLGEMTNVDAEQLGEVVYAMVNK